MQSGVRVVGRQDVLLSPVMLWQPCQLTSYGRQDVLLSPFMLCQRCQSTSYGRQDILLSPVMLCQPCQLTSCAIGFFPDRETDEYTDSHCNLLKIIHIPTY